MHQWQSHLNLTRKEGKKIAETVRIEIPIEVTDNTDPELSNIAGQFEQVDEAARQTQNSVNRASKTVTQFDKSAEKTQRSLSSWMKQKYQLLLEAKEKVMPVLNQVRSGLKSVGGKVWNVTLKAVDLVTAPLRGIFNLLKNPVFQVGAVLGVSIGFKDTVDTYANFEAAMSQVKAISGANGKDFENLNNKAKEMGATTKFTATEAAEAFNYMGMAGWKSGQMLDGIEGIMNLAAASGENLGTVSDIVTDALTAFGLKASDAGRFADVLAAAASSANTNVGMLGEAFKYVAPVAGALGYTIEDTSIALGLIANSGIKASMAGTALRSAFTNLVSPTDKMQQQMDLLGISATNADGSMKPLKELMDHLREKMQTLTEAEKEQTMQLFSGTDAAGLAAEAMQGLSNEEIKYETALGLGKEKVKDYDEAQLNMALSSKYKKEELKKLTEEQKRNEVALEQGLVAMEGMTKADQAAAAARIFGKEAMSGLLAIINASDKDYRKLTKSIYGSEGAAKKMSKTMLENLKGSFELLQSAAEGVKLSLGERFAPYLMDFSKWLTDQMPNIERGLMKFMDSVDAKIDALKEKIAEFTATDEWNNADFFGKVRIAWDEIIAIPFSEWWDSKGQEMITQKASAIGKGIGSAFSTGILALLGIDMASAVGEGASVGGAFARGLIDGFDIDALQEKIGEAISGIFSNASKILPGGEEADLSSWLSAALIAKIGVPLLGGAFKLGKLGKSIFGNTTVPSGVPGSPSGAPMIVPGVGRRMIGSFSLGEYGAHSAKGSGLAGQLGKVGLKLGSGATTSAGMVLSGGLGVAGGIAGGAALVSGISDILTGIKSDVAEERAAYLKSGAVKTTGVAAGATAGALIGGPLGALVGAGIGGIAGWLMGDSIKEDYEEGLRKATEEAQALALAQEQAKFKSKELKDALTEVSNGNMTESEFDQLYQKVVMEDMKSHFGTIRLSMQEIETLAKKITFGESIKSIEKFATASYEAQQAFSNLKASGSNMEKLNWKVSLGSKLNKSEKREYKAGVKDHIENAKLFEENRHYEGKAAIDVLFEPGSVQNEKMQESLNAVYSKIREQIEGKGIELKAAVKLSLKDGIISEDEGEIIANLQEELAAITQKIAVAEEKAEFNTLKIKYGADLDAESFLALQAELQEKSAEMLQTQEGALKLNLTNLELEYSEGVIDKKEYNARLKEIMEQYQANVSGLKVKLEDFQFEIVAENYGMNAETLKTALNKAMESGVDVTTWDAATAAKWLNLEGLGKEAQQELATLTSNIAKTFPEIIKGSFKEAGGIKVDAVDFDFAPMGKQVVNGASDAIKTADLGEVTTAVNGLKNQVGTQINTTFSTGFETKTVVRVGVEYRLIESEPSISIPGTTVSGKGSSKFQITPAAKANGDIINEPLLSLVGEDGPEAIIPLGNKRRSRGLSLWEKAGELLGVKKYAKGGIVGNARYSSNPLQNSENLNYINDTLSKAPRGNKEFSDSSNIGNESIPVLSGEGKEEKNTEVNVTVQVNPNFQINGTSGKEEDVVRIIKTHMREIADEIGGALAERLEMVFSNMPAEGWT